MKTGQLVDDFPFKTDCTRKFAFAVVYMYILVLAHYNWKVPYHIKPVLDAFWVKMKFLSLFQVYPFQITNVLGSAMSILKIFFSREKIVIL